MAFWGHSFIFNGVPCEDFDLMMYNIAGTEPGAGKFASGVTVVEQKLTNRWKPLFYGAKMEKKLEFNLVFGVSQSRVDKQAYFDRYELETIASWLTGHDRYMWLEIEQDDLEYIRYHCMISDLEMVEFGNIPMALKAKVTCDGPYAYLYPQAFEYVLDGTEQTIAFFNESSHNGYYKPKMEFEPVNGSGLSIVNVTDRGRTFELTAVDTNVSRVLINNEIGVITHEVGTGENVGSEIAGIDLYSNFNYNFLWLLKGINELKVVGNGILRIICEFPVNVGG